MVYLIVAFVVGKAITTPLRLFMANPGEAPFGSWTHSLVWVVANIALILAALGLLKWFDRRPPSLLGLGFQPGWLREVAVGLAAGIVTTGLVTLVLVVSGSVTLTISGDLAASLSALPRYLFLFTMAATVCTIGVFGAGVSAGRAPPRAHALLIWGRALLTRLCLLRR